MSESATTQRGEAQRYYDRLDEYANQSSVRMSVGLALPSTSSTIKFIRQYLEFRGYSLPRKCTLEDLSLMLVELSTKDAKTSTVFSMMLFDRRNE